MAEEPKIDEKVEDLPGIWWEHTPSVCVKNEILYAFTKKKELQIFNISYGRAGGKPDGEVVYVVTYWVDFLRNTSMATVTTPNSVNSCVLFRTFDIQLDPNLDTGVGKGTST